MVTLTLQNTELPKFWDLEVLGIKDPIERKNKILLEEETLTHFKETLEVLEGGRYEVALPWLSGHPPVYDMYDVAESRLRSVTKRLLKENIYDVYDDVLRQWQREGIIEAVPQDEISKPGHYLPHRPVIKPSSATTKVRPVFDASFKRPGYASLNECLSVGPSLSEQIPPLLLRFSTGSIGVIADIKQAFLQLSVKPEDRDFLRFLWWNFKDRSKLEFWRHCRVVFGVTSSPFLLNASIRHHLNSKEYQLEYLQPIVEKLKKGFYVDNLTTSVEDQEELMEFKTQTMKIMNAASFELRCWAHSGDQNQGCQNVLGLEWDTKTDELYCVGPDISSVEVVSKRKLLSVVNGIYDPVGFTSPATLLPKLLLQEAWRNKLDWDEQLPSEMQLRYQRWAKHLDLIQKCRIPRRILHGTFERASLHIFTDASAHGYACCAFLRCGEEEEVRVSLVSAKARVAPLQRPTIPRLELLGAAIGARIASTILETFNLPLKTYFWTDSMIVLGWITKTEPWNTFAGNRVKEIRELTNIEDWRFVPGDVNPADLPSRSCDWSELLRSQWWEGPKWLYERPEFWPYTEIILPDEAMLERRKSVAVNLNIEAKEHFGNRFLYFSSYPRIIRLTAWVLRFCQNIKVNSSKLTKELSYEEIRRGEETLIRIIQSEWPTDIREKYSQTIQFYEENEILKVQSRLILGQDPEDFVRPIVLPDHPIVRRLIEYTHKSLHHAGVQTTLSHLRDRFWIPRGRKVVREVLQKCMKCKRYTSKPVVPVVPAPLPIDRINRVAAFQVTGADLAENTKRLNWPLGRIIKLYQGKDNIERVVRLRVANGEIIRPVQRVYPLEISSPDISKDIHENVEGASDIVDDDIGVPVASNEKCCQSEAFPQEKLQAVKQTRFGRRVVPVKRLDL
ncbi:uncharacterized protein LOC129233439 [Uloborus diversus]|uniref:uncharacterized protein LOC129233439 n=1 Tax=Uloborus diversus TaxID=327109 RepID=UPI0024093F2E|nr:uncharacterized protein LOC129233439 [Uloborus diversus]